MPVNIPTPSMQWIGGMAALVSAISACIAVIFALLIHLATRRLLKRIERPIISLDTPQCKPSLISESQIRVDLKFPFKNIGKNPAQYLEIHAGMCPKKAPQLFKNCADISMANRIDPQGHFTWETHFKYTPIPGKELQSTKIDFLLYILLTYKDMFDPHKEYYDGFYLEYTVGDTTAVDSTMENRLALKPYIEEVYKQHIT